jgi:hypothetical protein
LLRTSDPLRDPAALQTIRGLGLSSAAPTLADQTLRDLVEGIPEESQSMQPHAVSAELEETEQQLVRKQLAQLEAARLASGDTVKPKGRYGFTQQLKMNAQPRGGTPNPRS